MVGWGSIVTGIGKACVVFFDAVKVLGSINSNVHELSAQTELLGGRREDLKKSAENMASEEKKQISTSLQIWSNQVKRLIEECHNVERRLEECGSSWNCFSCGCCFNYALAIEVARLLKERERLQTEYHEFTPQNMVIDVVPDNVEYIPFTFDYEVVGQEELLNRALHFIERTSVVGIWGMGGVGKTTLLKCIYNNFCPKRHPFAVVIFLTVGRDKRNIIIPKMQTTIGKAAGLLGLSENGDEEKQRGWIYNSLNSRNFLLIMDDLWETDYNELLEKIGIPPLIHLSEKQKVVIASRERKVCCSMGKMRFIVKMGLLEEPKSWQLFSRKVDEMVLQREEIRTIAEDMVDKCEDLPLALHHVGKSMTSSTEPYQWRIARRELESLRESSMMQMQAQGRINTIFFNSIVEDVLSILKLSFEELKCKVTRDILLKLLQSHNTLLMRSAAQSNIVETIFGDSRYSEEEEDHVKCCIKNLVDSSLLLEYREGLKLHVFVYDTFLWLKYTDKRWSPSEQGE